MCNCKDPCAKSCIRNTKSIRPVPHNWKEILKEKNEASIAKSKENNRHQSKTPAKVMLDDLD